AVKLVDGLEAARARAEGFIEQSLAMGTALAPEIGYEKAAALVKEADASGRTIRAVAREKCDHSAAPPAALPARWRERNPIFPPSAWTRCSTPARRPESDQRARYPSE